MPFDRAGKSLAAGAVVRFLESPSELTAGLPREDVMAIKAAVGHLMRITGFDVRGHAELEFVDADSCIHTIWVAPSFLALVE